MKHVAIIGAGPIGLDAALAAHALGLTFTVFEAGSEVGEHVRAWAHVPLFSPWSMNVSLRMREAVREGAGTRLPDGPGCPNGEQLYSELLKPIASLPIMQGRVRFGSRVAAVSREGLLKDDEIGTGRRAEHRFRLLIEESELDRVEYADIVVDCSGSWSNPNPLGDGGIPAVGERRAGHLITRTIPDFVQDLSWAGKSILLVGGGHSAQTAAAGLAEVFAQNPSTQVIWALRRTDPEFAVLADDALPERARLGAAANLLLRGACEGVAVLAGYGVHGVALDGDRARVTLRGVGGDMTDVVVDRIISLTGAVGDHSIYRQLQVHECYATSGPMKLAAALLGDTSADCLAQESHGVDVLKSPEPNFYLLGAKSYGRNSAFLLRIGYDQVTEVFDDIALQIQDGAVHSTKETGVE